MVNYGCAYDQDCSRAITIHEAARLWELAGGSSVYTVKMVAIAMAESCLDPYAVSQSCAVGAWQIVAGNIISDRPSVTELFSPYLNAQWAVRLSNGGGNVAAWDVAYAAGEALQRLSYLHDLQPGSAAYGFLTVVANTLGSSDGGPPPSTGGLPGIPNPEPQLTTPPDIPAAGPAPTLPPPVDRVTYEYPHWVAPPDYGYTGWEAIRRYFSNDLPYYTGYDADLVRILNQLPGGAE